MHINLFEPLPHQLFCPGNVKTNTGLTNVVLYFTYGVFDDYNVFYSGQAEHLPWHS